MSPRGEWENSAKSQWRTVPKISGCWSSTNARSISYVYSTQESNWLTKAEVNKRENVTRESAAYSDRNSRKHFIKLINIHDWCWRMRRRCTWKWEIIVGRKKKKIERNHRLHSDETWLIDIRHSLRLIVRSRVHILGTYSTILYALW